MSATTRDKLLEAAERLLIEQGVQALTVRRVGEVAGLNPTLITYHFGSVAALLQHLLERNLAPVLQAWEWLASPAATEADLPTILHRWLAPLHAPAAFHPSGRALIVMDEMAAHGDRELREGLVAQMLEVGECVAGILTPHLPHLPPGELRERLRLIAGAALGPPPRARLSAERRAGLPRDEAIRQLVAFAIAALSTR